MTKVKDIARELPLSASGMPAWAAGGNMVHDAALLGNGGPAKEDHA
jgi:hypothetical protein